MLKFISIAYVIFTISNLCGALGTAIGNGFLAVENLVSEASMNQLVVEFLNSSNEIPQSDHNCDHSGSSSMNQPSSILQDHLTTAFSWVDSDTLQTILEVFDIRNIARNFLDGVYYVIHAITVGVEPRCELPPNESVKRSAVAAFDEILVDMEEQLDWLHDDLCCPSESILEPHCSLTANNIPSLYILVDNSTMQITLLSVNFIFVFVLIAILMYVVASAVANHWPQSTFLFCGRPSVHTQNPELAGVEITISTGKSSDESVDYTIPAFFENETFIADPVSPTHSTMTWAPTLLADKTSSKEISALPPFSVFNKAGTRHEAEFEKHGPDPCSRPIPAATTESHDAILPCAAHSGCDIEPFILDLEALVMSHIEKCFPADSHTHPPERIMLLPPLEFSFDHSEREEGICPHRIIEVDRLSIDFRSTAPQLLTFSAENVNILDAENDDSRTELPSLFMSGSGDFFTDIGREGLSYYADTYNALDALNGVRTLNMEVAKITKTPTENQSNVHDLPSDIEDDSEGSVLIHSVDEPAGLFYFDCGEQLVDKDSMPALPWMRTSLRSPTLNDLFVQYDGDKLDAPVTSHQPEAARNLDELNLYERSLNDFEPPKSYAIIKGLHDMLLPLPELIEPADTSTASRLIFLWQSQKSLENYKEFIRSCMHALNEVKREIGELNNVDDQTYSPKRPSSKEMIDLLTTGVEDICRVNLLSHMEFSDRVDNVIKHKHRLQRLFSREFSRSWKTLTKAAADDVERFYGYREVTAFNLLRDVFGLLLESEHYLHLVQLEIAEKPYNNS